MRLSSGQKIEGNVKKLFTDNYVLLLLRDIIERDFDWRLISSSWNALSFLYTNFIFSQSINSSSEMDLTKKQLNDYDVFDWFSYNLVYSV